MQIITETYKINYETIRQINKLVSVQIETTQQYFDWVKQWKQVHQDLVTAIKFLRALKNISKQQNDHTECVKFWSTKKYFGRIARQMYKARSDNKIWFKQVQLDLARQ